MNIWDFFKRKTPRDQFAELVTRRARARGWPHEIVYDSKNFELNFGGPLKPNLFLSNAFKDWNDAKQAGRNADGELDTYIDGIFEADEPDDLAHAGPHLLPAIRNRADLECLWLDPQIDSEGRGVWRGALRPLCDALAVVIAIDRKASLKLADNRTLKGWNAEFEPLLEKAIANLRRQSPVAFERDPKGFFISKYNDHYDCSRLLTPEVFERLELRGDPVAIPVARNGVLVAGSKDNAAMLAMAAFAEEQLAKVTRPLSFLPLIYRNDSWSIFSPEDPALEPLRDLRAKQTLWDYERQRELLDAHQVRTGQDVYLARLEAKRFDGVRVHTWTTWPQGVVTWLPRADVIGIVKQRTDGTKLFLMRSWEDVWSLCGNEFVAEDFYPPRYAVPKALTDNQLAQLEHEFKPPLWLSSPGDGTPLS